MLVSGKLRQCGECSAVLGFPQVEQLPWSRRREATAVRGASLKEIPGGSWEGLTAVVDRAVYTPRGHAGVEQLPWRCRFPESVSPGEGLSSWVSREVYTQGAGCVGLPRSLYAPPRPVFPQAFIPDVPAKLCKRDSSKNSCVCRSGILSRFPDILRVLGD